MILLNALVGLQIYAATQCPNIAWPGQVTGTVTDPRVDEASGLAASQKNEGVFWTLNDSDKPACLYALTASGQVIHELCLDGAENFDWEAVATAHCADDGSEDMCLYVGDIGDNRYERQGVITIYRVPEPDLSQENVGHTKTQNWTSVQFVYPQRQPFNAEAMLIDPNTRELLIVTKSKEPPYSYVFLTSIDAPDQSEMEDTGLTLPLPLVTDASCSADGQVVIVRIYFGAFLWPRRDRRGRSQRVLDIMREQACFAPVGIQKQGESAAMDLLGQSYYVHSEGVGQEIIRFDLK